jgi:hypothetical protein
MRNPDAVRQSEHSRLLLSAARDVLRPLGVAQLGRSRLWVDDHAWWALVVEFQPSAFAKGSFLNVGAAWLWYAKDYWSFDVGHRVEPFEEFESVEQFRPVAQQLAESAARKVAEYREMFGSVTKAAKYLSAHAARSLWATYDAAVSAGLAGDLAASARLFADVAGYRASHDWERQVQQRARDLSARLADVRGFQAAVTMVVNQSRELHKLPKLAAFAYE